MDVCSQKRCFSLATTLTTLYTKFAKTKKLNHIFLLCVFIEVLCGYISISYKYIIYIIVNIYVYIYIIFIGTYISHFKIVLDIKWELH